MNGLDFQWSSQSADRCLTRSEIGASWGQEPASSSEEISIDGGGSDSTACRLRALSSLPSPLVSPAHIAFPPLPGHSLRLMFPEGALSVPWLWAISSCSLWTLISPLGQENTQGTGVMLRRRGLNINSVLGGVQLDLVFSHF